MTATETERVDVAVIGAGQAGLAMGYFLSPQGRRFVILEAADSIAAAWRTRWDSLVLFTPRRYSAAAGLSFPGEPDGYPRRDEVIAYLERYASTFELPVRLSSVPGLAGGLAPEVFRIHSTGYMRPDDVPPGTVLVVGGGNTGYQIALPRPDVAAHARLGAHRLGEGRCGIHQPADRERAVSQTETTHDRQPAPQTAGVMEGA